MLRQKFKVVFSERAYRKLEKIPPQVRSKLKLWVAAVEFSGLAEIRRRRGFHDEPLQGVRDGQRSIRLNRAYRAIYTAKRGAELTLVHILEVSKHEY